MDLLEIPGVKRWAGSISNQIRYNSFPHLYSGSTRSKRKYEVLIGTRNFMFENSIVVSDNVERTMQTHEGKGRTSVLVAIDSKNACLCLEFIIDLIDITFFAMHVGSVSGMSINNPSVTHALIQDREKSSMSTVINSNILKSKYYATIPNTMPVVYIAKNYLILNSSNNLVFPSYVLIYS